MFHRAGVELTPYRRNVELSVLAGQFVEDCRRKLAFRFYVPKSRLFAEQVGTMLDLFTDYLMKALGLAVRMTSHTARNGTTYEFYVDEGGNAGSIGGALGPFAEVMDLCVRDPEGAEELLVRLGADAHGVSRLVATYSKRMRRLVRDARQERERKVLLLRHQLENELEDVVGEASPEAIAAIVEHAVPRIDGPGALLAALQTRPISHDAGRSVVLNYQPQFIQTVNGAVAQQINGTQSFGPDAMQLLDLIERVGGARARELAADLHELEGGETTDVTRLGAVGRIRSFLASVASRTADKAIEAAIASAQAYLVRSFGL